MKKMGLFSSSRFEKLFSFVEVIYKGVYYKVFYTSTKKTIVSIEITENTKTNVPFKEGDKIDLVFDWISNSKEVELKKITTRK